MPDARMLFPPDDEGVRRGWNKSKLFCDWLEIVPVAQRRRNLEVMVTLGPAPAPRPPAAYRGVRGRPHREAALQCGAACLAPQPGAAGKAIC